MQQIETAQSVMRRTAARSLGRSSLGQQSSTVAMAKLGRLVAEYGKLAVGVHVCSSATWLGAAVTGVHYGLDVAAVAAMLPVELPLEQAGGSGSLAAEAALGFAIYKAAAPIRWPLTGAITAALVKYTGV
jgi:hypothetical protein